MHIVEAKSILSPVNGMNVYRGCTHGCIYCDSRSACYMMGHAFTDVEAKLNAPVLLEDALRRKRTPCMIGTGSMCDPYQPVEKDLRLTRQCLEIIADYGFGATVLTKSAFVLRDLDVLCAINERAKCVVQMTLTTFDEALCKKLEPNVSTTRERLEALRVFRDNGIPTVVWLSPILPLINDTRDNLLGLLNGCAEAGVFGIITFGMGLTLRDGSREYFYSQLDRLFPGLSDQYRQRYGYAYIVPSPQEAALMETLETFCHSHSMVCDQQALMEFLHAFPEDAGPQQRLFSL